MAEILVPSSSGEGHYRVTVTGEGEGVQIGCDCQAGQFAKSCKHKLQVCYAALGIPTGDGLVGDMSAAAAVIAGSTLPTLIQGIFDCEKALADAKRAVASAQRQMDKHWVRGQNSR